MTARLTSSLLASALIRRAESLGGFAAVLTKGDPGAGAILILAAEKGQLTGLYERLLGSSGGYEWAQTGPQDIENKEEIESFLARRSARDPDMWLIELDVPDAARFIAQQDGFA